MEVVAVESGFLRYDFDLTVSIEDDEREVGSQEMREWRLYRTRPFATKGP